MELEDDLGPMSDLDLTEILVETCEFVHEYGLLDCFLLVVKVLEGYDSDSFK